MKKKVNFFKKLLHNLKNVVYLHPQLGTFNCYGPFV